MNLIVFGIVLPWLFVGLGCWIGYLLVRQNGRILLHLEALEERLAQFAGEAQPMTPPAMPLGLPVGSDAPDFELPVLSGGRRALSEAGGSSPLEVT